MEKKEQFDIEPQKFEDKRQYKDIKPAAQSGDNDIDRIASEPNDEAKKETDEAYMQNQTGTGTGTSGGRQ